MGSEKYPFFAVAMHPETAGYAFAPNIKSDHSFTSVRLNREFAQIFVAEVKKNLNAFDTYD